MKGHTRLAVLGFLLTAALISGGCSNDAARTPAAPSPAPAPPAGPSPGPAVGIASDAELLALVTQGQPFTGYVPFPNVDIIRSGSSAHQPFVRVSMNETAFGALQNGQLPAGSAFPRGSIIFKETLAGAGGPAVVYSIMYKDPNNSNAGSGWLWAEYRPDRSVGYSISNRGGACTGCHALEQGPAHDFVRTFERQRR
jgi:hypothetical protein